MDVHGPLRGYFVSAPGGFGPWLENHIDHHDLIISSRHSRDGDSQVEQRNLVASTFKCWDERCIHYIYGFASKADRDRHATAHASSLKTEQPDITFPALPAPFPTQPSSSRLDGLATVQRPAVSIQLPPPALTSSLPPLVVPTQSGDPKDPFKNYTFGSTRSGTTQGLAADNEVDPLLPPLKRSRAGQPRLESIGELNLFRDKDPCLRCRISKAEVSGYTSKSHQNILTVVLQCDTNQPCINCSGELVSGSDDFLRPLGCCRGPITSLVDVFLPGD